MAPVVADFIRSVDAWVGAETTKRARPKSGRTRMAAEYAQGLAVLDSALGRELTEEGRR